MRSISKIAALIALVSFLACCSDADEDKRKLTSLHIDTVQKQVNGIDEGRVELQNRVLAMEKTMANLRAETVQSSARLTAARKSSESLRLLHQRGLGETPFSWTLRNPAFSMDVFWVVALGLFVIWLMWRFKMKSHDAMMRQEIDRVIDKLSREAEELRRKNDEASARAVAPEDKREPKAEPAAEKTVKPDPAKEAMKPAPVPEPVPEKAPEPKPAPPSKPAPEVKPAAKPEPAASPEPEPEPEPEKPAPAAKMDPPKKAEAKKTPKPKAAAKKKGVKKAAKPRSPSKKCKVKGCNNKHRSKGFCNKHYQQWRRGTLEEEIEE